MTLEEEISLLNHLIYLNQQSTVGDFHKLVTRKKNAIPIVKAYDNGTKISVVSKESAPAPGITVAKQAV